MKTDAQVIRAFWLVMAIGVALVTLGVVLTGAMQDPFQFYNRRPYNPVYTPYYSGTPYYYPNYPNYQFGTRIPRSYPYGGPTRRIYRSDYGFSFETETPSPTP